MEIERIFENKNDKDQVRYKISTTEGELTIIVGLSGKVFNTKGKIFFSDRSIEKSGKELDVNILIELKGLLAIGFDDWEKIEKLISEAKYKLVTGFYP